MRRALFAIALIPLLAGGHAVGAEAPGADAGASPALQKPPAATATRQRKPTRPVARRQADRPAAPASLSAAASYASAHSQSLPVAPPQRTAPPATPSWTGFYIGAGVGGGASQP